ncbi:MAG TPA: hypothetical protein VKR52_10010 [Terracidiphilus sp.]|nr:hypothetical protein [Terracidiphilus sp.]
MQIGGLAQRDSSQMRRFIGSSIILLAALVATAPQFFRGNTCGHDFDFHLVSWFDCLHAWREGILYPQWTPSPNFGAGEPRFIFYPPITWMLGAALGIVMEWKLVPMALTFLLLAGAGIAARALARQVLQDGPATLAGCIAIFSGYSLFTAYERTAFGELTGGFWVPLLLLFVLRDRNPDDSTWRRAFDGSAAPLALVLAGAWLSDVPLGLLASYLLAGMAVLAALLWRSWAPLLRAVTATILGLVLTSIYLAPALADQSWIDVHQATNVGYRIQDSWLFARHAGQDFRLHDIELFKVSTIGITMIGVALAAMLVCRLRGRMPGSFRWWFPLALIVACVLLLQFPVSAPVWNLLPKLPLLQFPWRWLVALEAPMGVFVASAVWVTRRRWRWLVLAACAAFFLATTLIAGFNFFQTCDEEDAVWAMQGTYRSGAGFEGEDEYTPPYADNSLVSMDLPAACLAPDPTRALGKTNEDAELDWSPDQHSCDATFSATHVPGKPADEHLRIQAIVPHAGYLILRLRSCPAWKIRLNGSIFYLTAEREDGLIVVPAPQGPIDLTADWTTSSATVAGRWISLFALLLIGAVYFMERKPLSSQLKWV